jgi:hypothetical protein
LAVTIKGITVEVMALLRGEARKLQFQAAILTCSNVNIGFFWKERKDEEM